MKNILLTLCVLSFVLTSCSKQQEVVVELPAEQTVAELPAPTDTTKPDAATTPYAASCSSINKDNLQDYLGRKDVLYIDLRDFKDYQTKHLRNFECLPFFAYLYDKEAGTNPEKIQLFGGETTEPVATYAESVDLLNVVIPKDKTVFLMCQSGGRVAMCMNILAANGYDMSKIYNVGGIGQYTSNELAPYVVDALEFKVDAKYSLEGLTRN